MAASVGSQRRDGDGVLRLHRRDEAGLEPVAERSGCGRHGSTLGERARSRPGDSGARLLHLSGVCVRRATTTSALSRRRAPARAGSSGRARRASRATAGSRPRRRRTRRAPCRASASGAAACDTFSVVGQDVRPLRDAPPDHDRRDRADREDAGAAVCARARAARASRCRRAPRGSRAAARAT